MNDHWRRVVLWVGAQVISHEGGHVRLAPAVEGEQADADDLIQEAIAGWPG